MGITMKQHFQQNDIFAWLLAGKKASHCQYDHTFRGIKNTYMFQVKFNSFYFCSKFGILHTRCTTET